MYYLCWVVRCWVIVIVIRRDPYRVVLTFGTAPYLQRVPVKCPRPRRRRRRRHRDSGGRRWRGATAAAAASLSGRLQLQPTAREARGVGEAGCVPAQELIE